jgi:hypothetical protein
LSCTSHRPPKSLFKPNRIFGTHTVLRTYTAHYNRERPHRGLALLAPEPTNADPQPKGREIKRRDRLGGLIHEYHRAAA